MARRPSPQLSLPGSELWSVRRPTDRLFFAVFPDVSAARRTAAIARDLRRRLPSAGQPLAESRFHVSLALVNDYPVFPDKHAAAACEAAKSVTAAPFRVAFDQAQTFHDVLVLRSGDTLDPLTALRSALCDALARHGLPRRGSRQFTPHMTLFYDAPPIGMQPVEPVAWTVREFVLIHSRLGETRHIPLMRWQLGLDDSHSPVSMR